MSADVPAVSVCMSRTGRVKMVGCSLILAEIWTLAALRRDFREMKHARPWSGTLPDGGSFAYKHW